MLFHRLALEAFCHATEDIEKVKEAMLNLVPFKVEDKDFQIEQFSGSFGNEIICIRLEFVKQAKIRALVEYIKKTMPKEELREFNVDKHVNESGEFWMRYDKQEAYDGRIVLGSRDTIQLKGKVAAFPASRKKAVELMQDLWF